MGQVVLAQVNTPAETEFNKSRNAATSEKKMHHKKDKHEKMAMMKELDMTEDQKARLKEMKEANKAKREVILSDSKLTEEQKHGQLKELHKAQGKNMQAVLTDDQKAKFKQLKEERKSARKANRGNGSKKGERATATEQLKAGNENE